MSQPKRYDCGMTEESSPSGIINRWPLMHSHPAGKYVLHSDYAALAAEAEHLKTRPTLANQYAEYATLAAENERLKETIQGERAIHRQNTSMWKDSIERFRFDYLQLNEENERLRKAGDAMADKIRYDEKMLDEDWGVEGREHGTVQAWLAAKEGRDAK